MIAVSPISSLCDQSNPSLRLVARLLCDWLAVVVRLVIIAVAKMQLLSVRVAPKREGGCDHRWFVTAVDRMLSSAGLSWIGSVCAASVVTSSLLF